MAGYFKKLNGHVYDGDHLGAVELLNGQFAELNAAGKVVLTTNAKDTSFRVIEKTQLWGMPAVVLRVTQAGSDLVYMVENEWDVNVGCEFNDSEYKSAVGDFIKMRRPTIGEEIIITVPQAQYNGLTVGATVSVAAGGGIA